MNYADIKKIDVANGPGVRVSLFVSGCRHRCPGCFNPETWDFAYGKLFDEQAREELFTALSPPYITGITLLGGDPMESENLAALLPLMKLYRERFPQKDAWCFTGYLFEDLMRRADARTLIERIDVLVDGPFVQEKKNVNARFKGSDNQRTIDAAASLAEGRPVLMPGYEAKDGESYADRM